MSVTMSSSQWGDLLITSTHSSLHLKVIRADASDQNFVFFLPGLLGDHSCGVFHCVLKLSFSQSLSLHVCLSLGQADLE